MNDYVVLTRQLRHCRRCRADTRWALERQLDSTAGVCLRHAEGHPTRERALTLGELLRALPVGGVGEPAQTAVEAPTDATWMWIVAGIRWRSCGCAHAGRAHGGDAT